MENNVIDSKFQIRDIVFGIILSLIIGFIFSFIFSNSCNYHEPINEKPGVIINSFFDIVSGHPEANKFYWSIILLFGIVLGFFIKKKGVSFLN